MICLAKEKKVKPVKEKKAKKQKEPMKPERTETGGLDYSVYYMSVPEKIGYTALAAAANVVGDRLADITEASMKAVRLMTRHLENMERTGRVKPYEVKAVTDALKNVLDVYKRLEENDSEEAGDDGLAGAMAEAALRVCAGGDDSGLLPDAPEEDGHGDP